MDGFNAFFRVSVFVYGVVSCRVLYYAGSFGWRALLGRRRVHALLGYEFLGIGSFCCWLVGSGFFGRKLVIILSGGFL